MRPRAAALALLLAMQFTGAAFAQGDYSPGMMSTGSSPCAGFAQTDPSIGHWGDLPTTFARDEGVPFAFSADAGEMNQAALGYGEMQERLAASYGEQPFHVDLSFLARAYYANDQRTNFTGQTSTFGAEGVIAGNVWGEVQGWTLGLDLEFFLNQTWDRNRLTWSPEAVSYLGNFDVDPFYVQTLACSARSGDWLFRLGKMVTPFGRFYFPLLTNEFLDAPFLRTESILWRETGLVLQYDPSCLVMTLGVTNGGYDRDTNSSKAVIGRVGVESDWCAAGASLKWQDGIGSETQKHFNNHIGVDAMARWSRFTLSMEAIYDEYGFRKPGFDPLDITWGRGHYYREQNFAYEIPITGIGYYFNLDIAGEHLSWSLNYGEYFPKQIGDPAHDVTTRRGLVKAMYHLASWADVYGIALVENDNPYAPAALHRNHWALWTGVQFRI
ncbi:MAG: hypothetical protein MUE50_12085 [Pirellulaceae bacterium]|nr:hypothetical protein [Pirellulaceae bacterium]